MLFDIPFEKQITKLLEKRFKHLPDVERRQRISNIMTHLSGFWQTHILLPLYGLGVPIFLIWFFLVFLNR